LSKRSVIDLLATQYVCSMQIKTRFIGSALLVMGLTVLLSGGRAVLMQQSEDALSRERQLSEQATSTVLDLNLAIRDELLIAQQSLLLNLQTDHLGRYHKASERFGKNLQPLQEILPQEDRVCPSPVTSAKGPTSSPCPTDCALALGFPG
jgi:hypothetical protein